MKCQYNNDVDVVSSFLYSFADLSAGISLLLDARNMKTHGLVKQLLDKLVVSTLNDLLLIADSSCTIPHHIKLVCE